MTALDAALACKREVGAVEIAQQANAKEPGEQVGVQARRDGGRVDGRGGRAVLRRRERA